MGCPAAAKWAPLRSSGGVAAARRIACQSLHLKTVALRLCYAACNAVYRPANRCKHCAFHTVGYINATCNSAQLGIRSQVWDPDTRLVDKGPTTVQILTAANSSSDVASAQPGQ